jgi:hypothetical protein
LCVISGTVLLHLNACSLSRIHSIWLESGRSHVSFCSRRKYLLMESFCQSHYKPIVLDHTDDNRCKSIILISYILSTTKWTTERCYGYEMKHNLGLLVFQRIACGSKTDIILRTALFWVVIQRVTVIYYRCFGISYLWYLQGPWYNSTCTMWLGTVRKNVIQILIIKNLYRQNSQRLKVVCWPTMAT